MPSRRAEGQRRLSTLTTNSQETHVGLGVLDGQHERCSVRDVVIRLGLLLKTGDSEVLLGGREPFGGHGVV